MASLNLPHEIRYRPCLVHGEKRVFHRWCTEEQAILKCDCRISVNKMKILNDIFRNESMVPPSCDVEIVSNVLGIVESESGEISLIKPFHIKFLDSDGFFRGYHWGDE